MREGGKSYLSTQRVLDILVEEHEVVVVAHLPSLPAKSRLIQPCLQQVDVGLDEDPVVQDVPLTGGRESQEHVLASTAEQLEALGRMGAGVEREGSECFVDGPKGSSSDRKAVTTKSNTANLIPRLYRVNSLGPTKNALKKQKSCTKV